MSVVEGLLRIKRVREDSRRALMVHAKRQYEAATQAVRRVSDLQQQRDRERVEREKSLYQDVCSRVVVVRDLTDLKFTVDTMKEDARTDAKAVADAQAQRKEKRQGYDEATGAWQVAARAAHKFQTYWEQECEEAAKHMERLADLELEEFPGRNVLVESMQEETSEEA